MTVEEIRSNIRYNESLIDQYSIEKQKIEKQIEELEEVRGKYANLQNRFGERQQQRQSKLAHLQNSKTQNSIFKKYYAGMNALLVGKDFSDTYDGLSEAKNKINRKINKLAQKCDDLNEKINYRKGRRDYWKTQLREALMEVK